MRDMKFKKEIATRVCARIPLELREKFYPIPLVIPYYHIVSDQKAIHVQNLYPYKGTRDFTGDLEHLLKHFDPVNLDDVLGLILDKSGFSRRAFHLTFDDGFREMHDVVAPILIRKGIPATFFLNSASTDNRVLIFHQKASILAENAKGGLSEAAVQAMKAKLTTRGVGGKDISSAILSVPYDKRDVLDELAVCMEVDLDGYLSTHKPYLDSSQIRHLIRQGFTIGSHSIDHPLFADIAVEEQVRQTVESTRFVRETFDLRYGAFAFPYTDRNVGERFFKEVHSTGMVDMTFGTAGMINGKLSRHMQRFSLEMPEVPAERIIAMEFSKRMWKGGSLNAPY
jgi:peptidoglycan/xylan/chitin deacetylase (PgdA/CDA1 family)